MTRILGFIRQMKADAPRLWMIQYMDKLNGLLAAAVLLKFPLHLSHQKLEL
jgi:hypothetical protein